MTPAWLTLAATADLPLWVGAMARHPRVPGQHLVVEVAPEGAVWTRCDDGRGVESRSFLLGHLPAPDLDHRPTRLEFVARLATRLGAPAEMVEEGVVFAPVGQGDWGLSVGRPAGEINLMRGGRKVYVLAAGTGDCNLALVRAWSTAGVKS